MLPVFPVKLSLMILSVVIAVGVLALAGGKGVSVLKKQGVAWGLTALMIVAAIGIGNIKALASSPERPAGSMYILDGANVLSASTENELADRTARLIDRYGVAIGVVTCNYGRDDLYDYAMKQAKEMDLRDSDFIVALDIRGDNYWLIQGNDLVDDFTDDDCGDYAWKYMEDAFAAGDYDSAVLKLTQALEDWYGSYFR